MRFTVLLALAATFTLSSGLEAQEATDTDVRQELRTMVAEDERTDDRAVILEFLEREDVQQVASEGGVDLEQAKRGVQTLGDGAAADLARQVLDADTEPGQLAGGDTIVITTTTVIIVLLILILLSV